MPERPLFFSHQIYDIIQAHRDGIKKEIDGMAENRLLNTSTEDLVDYLRAKFVLDVPNFDLTEIVASQSEAKIELGIDQGRFAGPFGGSNYATGTEIRIDVPFSGDKDFFAIQPSEYNFNPPSAIVHSDHITLIFSGTNLVAAQVKQNTDKIIDDFNWWLDRLRNDTSGFNAQIDSLCRGMIEGRKRQILSNQNLVAGLGFKVKANPNQPSTFRAPEVARRLTPVMPAASNQPYSPEPVLGDEDYEHILGVLDNMIHVMERSPQAFSKMDEEALRTHFLVQLNGHYEGQATGETFNFSGKTDILIRSGDKNIFIAECKFWKGKEQFIETINQILGYTAWRDTKTAVLVFNRNKDFSAVLQTIGEVAPTHQNFKKTLNVGRNDGTEYRYIFSSPQDKNRELLLTVKAYNVPA